MATPIKNPKSFSEIFKVDLKELENEGMLTVGNST
jgi:hypothetical protein